MLSQLIVTSVVSGVWGAGAAPQIALTKPPQFHIINRITLIGFIGSDAERKAANSTNIAIFSLATKTSWKNDARSWESRTECHLSSGRISPATDEGPNGPPQGG